jgi:hypothetical protein
VHSTPHELWARGLGTQVREVESGFRYTPTTTFETFAFPEPGASDEEIAAAASELHALRNGWLNPPLASEAEIRKRTLTILYNQRPSWLVQAHERLDRAVHAAYEWEWPLAADDVLTRLLDLNRERSQIAARRSVGAGPTGSRAA